MVWIHGGGWHFGSGNRDDNGPDYFMDEDIVIVTMNYRLGALGEIMNFAVSTQMFKF
jgi:carboxylesterase type B